MMFQPVLQLGDGGVPCPPPIAAAVAELADALDSGSSGSKIPWRFDSSQPHFETNRVEQGFFEAQLGPVLLSRGVVAPRFVVTAIHWRNDFFRFVHLPGLQCNDQATS